MIATMSRPAEALLREALYTCDEDSGVALSASLLKQVPEDVALEEFRCDSVPKLSAQLLPLHHCDRGVAC